jgi:hypothetical protein
MVAGAQPHRFPDLLQPLATLSGSGKAVASLALRIGLGQVPAKRERGASLKSGRREHGACAGGRKSSDGVDDTRRPVKR